MAGSGRAAAKDNAHRDTASVRDSSAAKHRLWKMTLRIIVLLCVSSADGQAGARSGPRENAI